MLNTVLDRRAIGARIPHQGRMCLLDGVGHCDDEQILCYSASHRAADNPLRNENGLPITAGVEYAAQAMALHGSLLDASGEAARAGYLASVRQLDLHADRLDDCIGNLEVRAARLSASGHSVLYEFSLAHAGRLLLNGRAAVILDAAAFTDRAGGQEG